MQFAIVWIDIFFKSGHLYKWHRRLCHSLVRSGIYAPIKSGSGCA